jgi:hypothetical protein
MTCGRPNLKELHILRTIRINVGRFKKFFWQDALETPDSGLMRARYWSHSPPSMRRSLIPLYKCARGNISAMANRLAPRPPVY